MAEKELGNIGDIDRVAVSQRRFKVMSDNLFKIINKLIKNKKVCMNGRWTDIGDIDWINLKNSAFNNYFQARKSTVFYLKFFIYFR